MSGHLIRLRGGWEILDPHAPKPSPRVTLPLLRIPDGPRRVALLRRFQTPALEPARETLWLRLDSVAGLVVAYLNDREIAGPPFESFPVLIPLGEDLPARNQLLFDVEFPDDASAFPWGEVALVIRSPGSDQGRRG